MRILGASSTAIRALTAGPAQPAQWLGAADAALYFVTDSSSHPTVFAVLTHDAARLPCGLVLATTATELPLTGLAPPRHLRNASDVVVGDSCLSWTGAAGKIWVTVAREWTPRRVRRGMPAHASLAALRSILEPCALGIEHSRVDALAAAEGDPRAQAAAVAGLLGRGPGLTPSGDDVLAGFLVGALAFGLSVPRVVETVGALSASRTTALSAQLLAHATLGEGVDALVDLTAATTADPSSGHDALVATADRLLRVGHTSGASLAWGVLIAGELVHNRSLTTHFGGHR